MERVALHGAGETAAHGLAMPHVEQRELRYFVAVAEELHFTRAAAKLEISQPPLSVTISRLEAKLGTQLFARDSRNVALTPAGHELLRRARRILIEIDEAIDAVRNVDRAHPVALRIATTQTCRSSVLPGLEQLVTRIEPFVAFDVDEVTPSAIGEKVRAGVADFGVVVSTGWQPGLAMRLLRSVPPVAVFDHTHPLARRRRLTLLDVAAYRIALWPEKEAPDSHRLVRSLFADVAPAAEFVILPILSAAWTTELEAGAVCVLPADAPLTSGFVSRPLRDTSVTFQTWLVWSDDVEPPFLDEMREAAAQFRSAEA